MQGFRIAALVAAVAVPCAAQEVTEIHPGRGGSPHVRTVWTVDGVGITIEYGRPSVKGRKIFGGLEPFGKVWRTGADEATLFVIDRPLTFGTLKVPAGKYTLWTWLDEKQWKLIVNSQTGQWGTSYDEKQDLGRVDMKTERLPATVERLTISIEDAPGPGGILRIEWEQTRASIAFRPGG
jgi:hypothetical protein